MFKTFRRMAPIVLAAALLLPNIAAHAGDAAPAAHLDFSVVRDGSVIGHHLIDRTTTDDEEHVSVKTNIVVSVMKIPVYRFEHAGSEVWRGGRLISLASRTNDDGQRHALSATAAPDAIVVDGDGKQSRADAAIIPASLWNVAIVKQSRVLNTLTGQQMSVTATRRGDETVPVRGSEVRAAHYTLTGDLERDLWYDGTGTLVQVRFKAKDGTDVLYALW